MHYYIFRFKASPFGKWLVGVCSGLEGEDTEHCGHIFSDGKAYKEATARAECIAMVKRIMAYWMAQAENLNNP